MSFRVWEELSASIFFPGYPPMADIDVRHLENIVPFDSLRSWSGFRALEPYPFAFLVSIKELYARLD